MILSNQRLWKVRDIFILMKIINRQMPYKYMFKKSLEPPIHFLHSHEVNLSDFTQITFLFAFFAIVRAKHN